MTSMTGSTPGFPVHHQLPEFTETHVRGVSDAIQPSHPLSSPFPPTFNLPQHQGLFKLVSSSHHVAKALELQLQHQSFQWIFRTDFFRIEWLDLLAVQGTLKSLLLVNKAEVDVFLEISCFSNDPTDVGNLISGSSAFSKSSLNIRKFMVHILLKSGLENFEHYFARMWDECNWVVVGTFFGIAFLWDWNENWPILTNCGHWWVF